MPTLWLVALLVGQVGGGGTDPEELVQRIQENLRKVDDMLLETAEADEMSSGFNAVLDGHRAVIRDLEELIRQARYTQSNQSSGGGGDPNQPPPQGQPPPRGSDGSQSEQPSDGQQPEPQSGQEQQPERSEGNKPEGGQPDASAGSEERTNVPPPPDEIGSFTREDTDGRWGLLPPKLQERLMNLHVDDVPEQYRAWLHAYIRSMNALEQGDGR